MKAPVTGVQLYTLRRFTKTYDDLARTLARLAAWGVRDLQFSALGPEITPQEQKELLDRFGMRVCVTHQSFARLRDELPAVIEAHKVIGCDSVGLGYTPEDCRTDEDTARAYVKTLSEIAQRLKKNGLQFHYHNHDFELKPLSGSDVTLMDLLLHETDPALVHFIPDVAWLHYAGVDPAPFLRRIAGRTKVVHFKDYVLREDGSPQFVSLGRGCVDLSACFSVCGELRIPYVMYEQDNGWTDDDPFLSTKESLEYFDVLTADLERRPV